MAKKSDTSIVEATSSALTAASDLNEWGQNDLGARDFVIPKILLMQNTSELVGEGKAKLGDFIDSITGDVLGAIDRPIQFIPFHMDKMWIISSRPLGDSKFEFDRYEPVSPANMDRPLQEVQGNREVKYEYTLQFYVLRPEDPTLPYVLSFKSTSARAGKVLSTQMFVRNRAAGLVPPAHVMELSGKREKNDKGIFAVMEVKAGPRTSPELVAECLNWFKVIKAGKATVAPEPVKDDVVYADDNVKF